MDETNIEFKKMYLSILYKQAQKITEELKTLDESQRNEVLAKKILGQINDWQKVADETQLKNIKILSQILTSSFELGVAISSMIQRIDITQYEKVILKLLQDNKELKEKAEQFQEQSKFVENTDTNYIG